MTFVEILFIMAYVMLMILVMGLIIEYEQKRNPKITITEIKPKNWRR